MCGFSYGPVGSWDSLLFLAGSPPSAFRPRVHGTSVTFSVLNTQQPDTSDVLFSDCRIFVCFLKNICYYFSAEISCLFIYFVYIWYPSWLREPSSEPLSAVSTMNPLGVDLGGSFLFSTGDTSY